MLTLSTQVVDTKVNTALETAHHLILNRWDGGNVIITDIEVNPSKSDKLMDRFESNKGTICAFYKHKYPAIHYTLHPNRAAEKKSKFTA